MRGALAFMAAVVLTAPLGAQSLPEGAGRAIVERRCLMCHEADLIVSQRLSPAGWGREVDKMVRWGAVVDDAEREPLVAYLAAHFAPAPVASHAPETLAAGEAVYNQSCLTCHESDLVAQQRLSRAGWVREVDKMIRWGAQVPEDRKDALVDYLAAKYPVK